MKNEIRKTVVITTTRIILGILSIIIPFVIVGFLTNSIIRIHDYDQLKWIALLICASGFYISGIINRKTPLILIPLLYISLIIFIPLRYFYFPLIYFLILFATFSLLITRNEFQKKFKITSVVLMSGLFIYFLFSQPLIIKQGKIINTDQYGDLVNGKTIWDFTKKKSNLLPESSYLDSEFNPFDLKSLKNKTLYISFWATWCEPCFREKPELDKLKEKFKDNPNIVFIDISVDEKKMKWREFIDKNTTQGIQLIAKDYAKTRNVFNLSGIPEHLVVNNKGQFAKARFIDKAYLVLSDAAHLDKFINKTLPKGQSLLGLENYKMLKYVEQDPTNKIFYTTNQKDRLIPNQLNILVDEIRKKEKPNFIKILIEKNPFKVQDSIIYNVTFFKIKESEIQFYETEN